MDIPSLAEPAQSPQLETNMNTLAHVLRKPIVDNERTRKYQAVLDKRVDNIREGWNLETGLINMPAGKLPHQTIDGFWRMNAAERAEAMSPELHQAYERNAGRSGTGPLSVAAFCYYNPMSRHHGDPELLTFFENGFRFHLMAIQEDGYPGTNGLNGEGWAHGWDIEGLIYGSIFLQDVIDPELIEYAKQRMRLGADRMMALEKIPSVIGSYGNQRAVYALGLYLYNQFLGDEKYKEQSDHYFQDALPKILDDTGQVIEQYGPCMHYSYTAFIYAWLNLAVRNDTSQLDRIARHLEWFCMRHTTSLYPIAGPSTRQYRETVSGAAIDLMGAAEQLAHVNTGWRGFVDRIVEHFEAIPPKGPHDETHLIGFTNTHGSSPLIWAMLMAQDESKWSTNSSAPVAPSEAFYSSSNLLKRAPFRYLLMRRQYQTHFNSRDFLPFSGIQTWAIGDEPPIIHPTTLAQSTTIGEGLNTAKQGVSNNWGGYGAGAVGIDSYTHGVDDDNDQFLIVARYDWLWRVMVFTDISTVVIEFGKGGDRRTLWTLNRVEPAEPTIESGLVRFAGRRGCIHSSLTDKPALLDVSVEHELGTGLRQLQYQCGDSPAGFALSDDSFKFESSPLMDGPNVRFSDGAGSYELRLDERLLDINNPGNFSVDVFQLAAGTTVKSI